MTSADLNQDGHGDLVVGAPGYSRPGHVHVGRVYLLYGSDLGLPPIDLDLDQEAHGILEGFQCSVATACILWQILQDEQAKPLGTLGVRSALSKDMAQPRGSKLVPLQPSGRFGSALAVLDFNQDGVPDLAVGAPSVGSDQLTYKVRLLLG
ncbi:Glycosylphosphatidylinositol specific phospholipase D1 [Saguinus oedipus]|uniref:Glycosylphosphatidylinositol specific phospholipase D1 n=1 Tax=Saguinus oedipus TaxID=9490 RepID=A0ABQ9VU61_SAGOE|nr:Glycosylphosphatidylinositol specific phospholipase D1 [Saguinus oedipus]